MKRLALIVAVAAVAAGATLGAAATASARTQATTRVQVIMGHPGVFEFVLSKKTVPRGTVTFMLVNRGQIAHDFSIDGKKSKLYQPGQQGAFTVVLKAGRYPYKCTVPGHAQAGMKGVLIVR